MTGDARFCPQCGTRRAGFFRFCPKCGFDYDELLPAEVRQAADPKAPAPTRSTLARPVPLPTTLPPAPAAPPSATPVATAAPGAAATPAAVIAAAPAAPPAPPPPTKPAVWPPPGAAPAEQLELESTGPEAIVARAALVGSAVPATRTLLPDDDIGAPGASVASTGEAARVARPTRSARVLTRRPDLTLTRVAIVVLAALLGFSALSNLARSSSNSSSTTSPQTSIGSPLTEATPGASDSDAPAATIQPAFAPTGSTETATVASITDGDTIRVKIDGREVPVRYIGMDTPEPDATDPALKQMAIAATAANASLVEGQQVVLEREVSDTDRFNRLLRDVWLVDQSGNYALVNIELVRLGLAKIATFPPDVRYVRELTAAQKAAQDGGLGVWGLGQPSSGAPEPEGSPAAPASPAAAAPTPQTLVGGVNTSQCHPSYDPCLPIVDDLDCGEVRAMVDLPVQVKGPDDYNLDADGDGTACEVGY